MDINGQYKGAYGTKTNSLSNLDFKSYSVIKATIGINSNFTPSLLGGAVPAAGVKAILIVSNSIYNPVILFDSASKFITTGNVTLTKSTTYAFTFVSDGSNMIETSRSEAMN